MTEIFDFGKEKKKREEIAYAEKMYAEADAKYYDSMITQDQLHVDREGNTYFYDREGNKFIYISKDEI